MIAVEVPGPYDVPTAGDVRPDVAVAKSAIKTAEPSSDQTRIALPQHVRSAVSVEVPGADDMPVARDGAGCRLIADEASVPLAQPLSKGAVVVSPNDVGTMITIEVPGADDVPASRDIRPR